MDETLIRIRYFKNGKVSLFYNGRTVRKMLLSDMNKPAGYITSFYVNADHRCKGLGSVLMHAVLLRFKLAGCTAVSLQCFCDNHKALKFYYRFGFFIALQYDNKFNDGNNYYLLSRQI